MLSEVQGVTFWLTFRPRRGLLSTQSIGNNFPTPASCMPCRLRVTFWLTFRPSRGLLSTQSTGNNFPTSSFMHALPIAGQKCKRTPLCAVTYKRGSKPHVKEGWWCNIETLIMLSEVQGVTFWLTFRPSRGLLSTQSTGINFPTSSFTLCQKKLISDTSRQSSVRRKRCVTVFASVIRAHQWRVFTRHWYTLISDAYRENASLICPYQRRV
jgi:hypothetical protein